MSTDYLLREFIDRVARTPAQLDRLLSDHFHDVYIQLHGSMTRDERLTVLFSQRPGTAAILAALKRSFHRYYAEAALLPEFSALFSSPNSGATARTSTASAAGGDPASFRTAPADAALPSVAILPAVATPMIPQHNAGPFVLPENLLAARARGRIVPFVGAGVSMGVRHRTLVDVQGQPLPLFPGWTQLLLRATDKLRANGKSANADAISGLLRMSPARLLDAARYAEESLGPLFYPFLREQLDPDSNQVLDESLALPRLLWKIGSKLLITTNYDRVLRWACPDELRNNLNEIQIQARVEQLALLHDDASKPTVWHLHGSVGDLENLVLTPNGYDFLYPQSSNGEVRYQAALQTLRTLLATRTFLFVGFSFTDDRFGDQLRWIADTFAGASGPHYLLARERDVALTRERLRGLTGVEIIPFADFGEPLMQLLAALT